MKKLVLFALTALLLISALAGCGHENEYVPEGPTQVDYGEVSYVPYDDGSALKFNYLDCFVSSSEDEEQLIFVANTEDDKGVLTYEFFDSFRDYEHNGYYYMIPSRKYAEIASFSEEQAREYMKIALGMVDAQNADYTIDDFKYEKNEHYVCLSIEATAEYRVSGEIQKMWLVKYVVDNERVYTLHAFVPASCVTKYGPVFKDVEFDPENALTNSAE